MAFLTDRNRSGHLPRDGESGVTVKSARATVGDGRERGETSEAATPQHHMRNGGSGAMRKLMGLKVALLVVCLLTMAAVPATAQLADPLSLAASGVLLPFFSDPAAGFVSVLEIVSPVVATPQGFSPPFNFTNPLHAVFFLATCARDGSISTEETAKQAKAFISNSVGGPGLGLTFNGLAAIGSTGPGHQPPAGQLPATTR